MISYTNTMHMHALTDKRTMYTRTPIYLGPAVGEQRPTMTSFH